MKIITLLIISILAISLISAVHQDSDCYSKCIKFDKFNKNLNTFHSEKYYSCLNKCMITECKHFTHSEKTQ